MCTRTIYFSSILLILFFLQACAEKQLSTVRGTNSYTVRGETYYPLQSAVGYDEEGVASWYGPGFHGNLTANGETYNQNDLTAAHKLLPLGTDVQVINLENGRSVELRVNDRGPFVHDRIIDLSRRAAEVLDMHNDGVAMVRVIAIGTDGVKFDNIDSVINSTNSTSSGGTNYDVDGDGDFNAEEFEAFYNNASPPSGNNSANNSSSRNSSSSNDSYWNNSASDDGKIGGHRNLGNPGRYGGANNLGNPGRYGGANNLGNPGEKTTLF